MKKKTIRLGAAGALTALSLAGLTVPAQAAGTFDPCGPVVESLKFCTGASGASYMVLVGAASAPRPIIGGALLVGNTLSIIDNVWDPVDATLTYQWLRNDVPILGATKATYRLTRADLGKGIRVRITGSAPGYQAGTVQSTKTAAVTDTGGAVPTIIAPATAGFGNRDTDTDETNPIVDAFTGIWSRTPHLAFHYQWLRNGVPIPGATAAWYDTTGWGPTALLSVRITGYAPGYDPATVTSEARPYRSWTPYPVATIAGGTGLGDVLTGVDSKWYDPTGRQTRPFEHVFQWLRDGVAIPGATELSYTITAEDQGHTLVLNSHFPEYTEAPYYRFSSFSNAIVIPAGPAEQLKQLTNVTRPVLTGTAVAGTPMTVTPGTWSEPAENLTFAYSWMSPDGKVSSGGPTFTPGPSQAGATVSAIVTVSAPGFATARVTVTAPKPVTAPPPPDPTQVKAPSVRGTAEVRKWLTVSAGTWSGYTVGLTESRQWLRNGTPIAGATGLDYHLVGDDYGKTISVKVTTKLNGRTLKTQTSEATATVAAAALSSSTPTVSGTVKVGNLLTVNRGTWTWQTDFKYRWLRDGVPISGATASTYKVRTADRDRKITVRVTGSRLGYTTVSKTSGPYLAR